MHNRIPTSPKAVAPVLRANDAGKTGYHGPCPPSGSHRYCCYVFNLDTDIDLPEGAAKGDLNRALEGHILVQGSLMGRYGCGTHAIR